MKKLLKIVSAFSLCLTFIMCSEPELSNVVIKVYPEKDSLVTVESGDMIQYDVEISTINEYVKRFKIFSFDAYQGTKTYIDSICGNDKSLAYKFYYEAPDVDRDSLSIELNIEAEDNLGNIATIQRYLLIKSKNLHILQLDGIVLYNPHDNNASALSLNDVTQPFIFNESVDSLKPDVYVQSTPDFSKINLCSNEQTMFVRNNSFNYVAATARGISSVYESSVKENIIQDLNINDIILVGYYNTAKGVFKVNNIIRDNTNRSCFQLSYKEIK